MLVCLWIYTLVCYCIYTLVCFCIYTLVCFCIYMLVCLWICGLCFSVCVFVSNHYDISQFDKSLFFSLFLTFFLTLFLSIFLSFFPVYEIFLFFQFNSLISTVRTAFIFQVANRRLFSVVREERRLTYDASFQLHGHDSMQGGWYSVSVTSNPSQVLFSALISLLYYPLPISLSLSLSFFLSLLLSLSF